MKDDVDKMKQKIKPILITFMLLATLMLVTACSWEDAYDEYDEAGYTFSVRFDANGGLFGDKETPYYVDCYRLSDYSADSDGIVALPLLDPGAEDRGDDAKIPVKSGYFFAGWYEERVESKDSEGKTVYTYAKKWDFEKSRVKADSRKTYTSREPQVTLYAAWIPMFQIDFYSRTDGQLIGSYTFNPTTVSDIKVPAWNEETGALDMENFPKVEGYTFEAAYYDKQGENAVTETVIHTGTVDEATATATGHVMNLYVDLVEGEWYRISTVEQFKRNISPNGCYELLADLDFKDQAWPGALPYGNFGGTIRGNGHVIKNVRVTQNDNSRNYAGLFGRLTENARISDLTFEGISFTIKVGSRVPGVCMGLLAGSIIDGAVLENVAITKGELLIDSDCYFQSENYAIGLLCGMGDENLVDYSNIACNPTGKDPDSIQITVDGNTVTFEKAK